MYQGRFRSAICGRRSRIKSCIRIQVRGPETDAETSLMFNATCPVSQGSLDNRVPLAAFGWLVARAANRNCAADHEEIDTA